MVTGGFRQSIAMKQAIESGGVDVIGLGRPMCVVTDAPNQLLNGTDELPRYESQLALFPKWLSWLTKLKILRTVSSFAVQYWYYGQLDSLGRTGKADPDLSVWAVVLFWLGDNSSENEKTWDFLDRRLSDVMGFEKFESSVRANAFLKPLSDFIIKSAAGIKAPVNPRSSRPGNF